MSRKTPVPARLLPASRPAAEDGSAIADFVLHLALLLLVAGALIQLSWALWMKTVLTDIAGEAARAAALYGAAPDAAQSRVQQLQAAVLPQVPVQVTASRYPQAGTGLEIQEVRLSAPVPLLGVLGVGQLEVRGRAPVERLG